MSAMIARCRAARMPRPSAIAQPSRVVPTMAATRSRLHGNGGCMRAGGRAPTEALDEYVERRRPRVSWVQEESAAAARSFRLSPAVRNAALREGGEEILRRRFMPVVATP